MLLFSESDETIFSQVFLLYALGFDKNKTVFFKRNYKQI